MPLARFPVPLALGALVASCASPAHEGGRESVEEERIRTVLEFREARKRGQLERALGFLSDDPRVWWDEKVGMGSAWRLEGGPWKGWDEHFRGVSEPVTPWTVEGDAVWADIFETNDYFQLVEREGGYWRATYFFDDEGRISGFMVSGVPGREPPVGRAEEFREWAFRNEPEEAAYLMPDGRLDPTGDRPPRMRALLNRWRATVGLEPIL